MKRRLGKREGRIDHRAGCPTQVAAPICCGSVSALSICRVAWQEGAPVGDNLRRPIREDLMALHTVSTAIIGRGYHSARAWHRVVELGPKRAKSPKKLLPARGWTIIMTYSVLEWTATTASGTN